MWENDLARTWPAAISYAVFAMLPFVALLHYAGDVNWSELPIWTYVLFMLNVLLAGVCSWMAARSSDQRDRA